VTDVTPYPELNEVLRELLRSIRGILGDNFIGGYLQGSFAIGDFDEHSDCDFAIVIENDLTESQVEALQSMHKRIFNIGMEWAKHLEGSYFPRAILRECANRGKDLWYLNNGHSQLERSDHCNTGVVRWTLREHGVILSGPEPSTLVDPIPADVLRREIFDVINDWAQEILADPEKFNNRFYQSFIVLSYCRMLNDLRTGTIQSKRAGAEWAKRNLDASWVDLIDRTWAGRPNPARSVRETADPADFKRTLEFAGEAVRIAADIAAELGIREKKTS
jgi:hypothetical protein